MRIDLERSIKVNLQHQPHIVIAKTLADIDDVIDGIATLLASHHADGVRFSIDFTSTGSARVRASAAIDDPDGPQVVS